MFFDDRAAPSDASIDAALAELHSEGRPFMLIYRLFPPGAGERCACKPWAAEPRRRRRGTLVLNTDRVLSAVEGS